MEPLRQSRHQLVALRLGAHTDAEVFGSKRFIVRAGPQNDPDLFSKLLVAIVAKEEK
jgi:hypothetical protein